MTFDSALKVILSHEGKWSNDQVDRGKETYKGISRIKWPVWSGWSLIDAYKKEIDPSVSKTALDKFNLLLEKDMVLSNDVVNFYRIIFWDALRCDDMPDEIRFELFDTAINQGKYTAVFNLQRALNLLNQNGKLYADISTDGKMGPGTVQTARACPYKVALHNTMNILQAQHYIGISEKDKTQEKFFRGWITQRVSWLS
jgi:lysozyme family protein